MLTAMAFNENTRVKIPAILHLCRLGYKYLSLSNSKWDENTNIFTDIFIESITRINPGVESETVQKALEQINLVLDNEDLGQTFYQMLTATSGVKLLDFSDFSNNSFHVVTELTSKNGEEEFRPDVTLLINGMPLAFIEVKKPNNKEGVIAERDRINTRFKNKKFRKFLNSLQLLIFSNNMEYDTESIVPVQGAFYSTTSHQEAAFNCFREEEPLDLGLLLEPEDEAIENLVLKDNNLLSIKHSPEFNTNKNPNSPTNRILTSLCSKERLAMFLRYGIAYVKSDNGIEKHIMRYPQFFASRQIKMKLDEGTKKGIIWHTQGSGKTALAYYNVQYLTDHLSSKGVIPKFYFIVDRIDLMIQAKNEFTNRGLEVHTVDSREELLNDFQTNRALHGLSGKKEITVVNIQKFENEADVLKSSDYDINTQRIYFLDEVHRSYNPTGSFLASLVSSDRNAIIIGLTGTPLIADGKRSRDIFGDYIHKYYYNQSIADGYTLRLIREGIETNYKIQLDQILKEIEVLKGDGERRVIYSHEKFVEPMIDYIVDDFVKSRVRLGDQTIGAMVVCDSADQARKMFEIFKEKYGTNHTGSLILHDEGDKEERRNWVEAFKAGKIDFLFVYNMLLTGFDAKRLKKLYLGRVIKDHNLLQTLTRVNRPYREFRYGFVVDFADIRKEFDATNKAYFEELQQELGDELKTYSNLFKSKEEIDTELKEIEEQLFHYDLKNSEIFSQQISQIEDRTTVLAIKKALESARNLYNIIRLMGHEELLKRLDFKRISELYNETTRHLELLNLKESLEKSVDSTNLLNVALQNVLFKFVKVSESELVIADQFRNIFSKTQEAMANNFDKKDPEYISLYEELQRVFKKKKIDEITNQGEMKESIQNLQLILEKITELNRKNSLLKAKYENDVKYARLHKRVMERKDISQKESEIHVSLTDIKHQTDEKVLINNRLLDNEGYFEQLVTPMVINGFNKAKITLDPETAKYVNNQVVKEYVDEFQGVRSW